MVTVEAAASRRKAWRSTLVLAGLGLSGCSLSLDLDGYTFEERAKEELEPLAGDSSSLPSAGAACVLGQARLGRCTFRTPEGIEASPSSAESQMSR